MPKAFSEEERDAIKQRLLDAGEESWGRFGIKRTSVDDLARQVGISKGTFYLFFESKELFFMEVLDRCQARIATSLLAALQQAEGTPCQRFVQVVLQLYRDLRGSSWLVGLLGDNREYEQLVRGLPAERIRQHILADDRQAEELLQLFGLQGQVSTEVVSAALRGLFLLLLHRQELGERQLDQAWQLLLEGLALRIFGGDL